MAKYPYIVKYNGELYEAGKEVPIGNEKGKAVEETLPPTSVEDDALNNKEDTTKQYGKTEINRMDKAELQELAENVGIDGAEEMTGGALKKLLLEHFGL